jgi:hypothetical protein
MAKSKSFMAIAKSWLTKRQLHGPHAFLRFVMLVFVQRLNEGSTEFIFKGGNLLWLYIDTPRSTTDADFVTRTLKDHASVKSYLESVCSHHDESIQFSVIAFEPIEKKNSLGASVTIQYTTHTGQQNTFDLDIVYAIASDTTKINSPIGAETDISVVTIENIIADKLSACHQFKSGNTRMKDFDDLWRISKFRDVTIEWSKLRSILISREIESSLNSNWQNELMARSWQSHLKRNQGLPEDLTLLMAEVNEWLKTGLDI